MWLKTGFFEITCRKSPAICFHLFLCRKSFAGWFSSNHPEPCHEGEFHHQLSLPIPSLSSSLSSPLSKSPSILLLSSSRPEAFQAHINHTQSYSSTQVVEKARHAVLVCEASGSPKPTITWIKDTMPIDLKANPRLSLMKQGKLRGKAAVTKFGRFYVRKPFYNCTQTSWATPVFQMFVFGVNT